MHRSPDRRGAALWMIAGTGEGPPLARTLLQRGWWLDVSVVDPAAARAYPDHPRLRLRTGAIADSGAVLWQLSGDGDAARAYHWVIDASHPFALRISATLRQACAAAGQPLLRLHRPVLPSGSAVVLDGLPELGRQDLEGRSLLLAIGARRLAEAVRRSPGALHHARILPRPAALRQAMAAGLAPDRVACLWPGSAQGVERALCRAWGIEVVLCRQSGGANEARWHGLCDELNLRLLLLLRPGEPDPAPAAADGQTEILTAADLLRRVGWPGTMGGGDAARGAGAAR